MSVCLNSKCESISFTNIFYDPETDVGFPGCGFTVEAALGRYEAAGLESRESEQNCDFCVGFNTSLFLRHTAHVGSPSLRRGTKQLSQHLER